MYEIDFLPVGDGESSGDAICLRYSNDSGNTWIVGVIDGGTKDSGEAICLHINQLYETSIVDFLICTHPDQDHASGLSIVLENLTVKKVLMHCPWDYVDHIFEEVNDGRVTKESLRARLIDKHPFAYRVYELAQEKNIPIFHPFSDINNHNIPNLVIAGPSQDFYLNQVINFRSITNFTEESIKENDFFEGILKSINTVTNWLVETWNNEALTDPEEDATSSENNSSVISYFNFNGHKALLTADAGTPALEKAADYLENYGEELKEFKIFQVPHHGSRRNIGPSILNRLIGHPKLFGENNTFIAFISCSKNGEPKHPNKKVVNALTRRGGRTVATQGEKKCYLNSKNPDRGWPEAIPLPFYDEIECDD